MIRIEAIWLSVEPLDMRAGTDTALARVVHVFGAARPGHVVVTTPNQEYNQVYGLANDQLRHRDHRFEWTREEFRQWIESVKKDYQVTYEGLGTEHPELGHPSQMAVLRR